MERTILGRNGPEVSAWCLGTMTFGNQTPEGDAHRQMDMALEAGITFWDCAEMYPVNPVARETAGRSEEIIGRWFAARGRRADVQIATKVAGPGNVVRGDGPLTGRVLSEALEASLRKLQVDQIDLYQIHWPARGTWAFRRNWGYDPSAVRADAVRAHMDDLMGALTDEVARGRIRAFGLSNETAWGLTRWADRAEATGGPRPVSVQNEYSLLARLMDTDTAEAMVAEDITLLAFSPLGAGFLTAKYQDGAVPPGSRLALSPGMGGRDSARVRGAVAAYQAVADAHGMDLVHMALAFTRTRPFRTVPIFGATTAVQLQRILGGQGRVLSAECRAAIEAVHRAHPMPY